MKRRPTPPLALNDPGARRGRESSLRTGFHRFRVLKPELCPSHFLRLSNFPSPGEAQPSAASAAPSPRSRPSNQAAAIFSHQSIKLRLQLLDLLFDLQRSLELQNCDIA
jgi:hypothetical protein